MFQINPNSRDAIYLQLKEQVVRLALAGVLAGDEQLPSVRVLARELGINPNTVSKAYQELETEGVLYSVAGKGSFVKPGIQASGEVRRKALDEFAKAAGKAWQLGIRRQELTGVLDRICGKGDE